MSCGAFDNPFRVARVHLLPYQLRGETWDEITNRCATAGFRGAVVGPHGSGKTMFLIELARRLRHSGHTVNELFTNNDAGFALPPSWSEADRNSIVMADGYDSLTALQRLWLRRRYPRLIVTTHHPCSLPALHVCEARAEVLAWAVATLTGHRMDHEAACVLLSKHHNNMRDAIRELYDLTAKTARTNAIEISSTEMK